MVTLIGIGTNEFKSYGRKERICNKCKILFITHLDKQGFCINTRCASCKNIEKRKAETPEKACFLKK